jgi:hypothetical protein
MRKHVTFAIATAIVGLTLFFWFKSTIILADESWISRSGSYGPIQILTPVY